MMSTMYAQVLSEKIVRQSAADVLEMHGLVPLADALRKQPKLGVKFIDAVIRNQGTIADIAERNSDIPVELIKKLVDARNKMITVVVGDLEAAVDANTAAEIRRVLHT